MSASTEAEVVGAYAQAAAAPTQIDPSKVYSLTVPDGAASAVIDLEHLHAYPRRASGTVILRDGASFIAYLRRHAGRNVTATEDDPDGDGTYPFLYADQKSGRVTAVFNDDIVEAAGWRDHRAELRLEPTPEWQHWSANNGKLMSQDAFAEHIQAGLSEIVTPTAAEMLELAESFAATNTCNFRSSHRLASGQRELVYAEKVEASAGGSKKMPIPDTFALGIAPWTGTDRFKLEAWLRYRINDGRLVLGYTLIRPHEVLISAFEQVTGQISDGTGGHVLNGQPAESRTARGASIFDRMR
jgi:uncharacterized protein YfdQ (DUF2303 family)